MKYSRYKWAAFRLFIYFSNVLTLLSFGTLYYIFAPATSYICFGTIAFWRHIKDFHRLFLTTVSFAKNIAFSPATGYHLKVYLFEQPRIGPDPAVAKLAPSWKLGLSDCGGCHTCCDKFGCYLIGKDGRCICYGSPIWKYLNCGRFPENQKQLDFYECPKWIVPSGSDLLS